MQPNTDHLATVGRPVYSPYAVMNQRISNGNGDALLPPQAGAGFAQAERSGISVSIHLEGLDVLADLRVSAGS